jgi:hypothetical protein
LKFLTGSREGLASGDHMEKPGTLNAFRLSSTRVTAF